jgi:hypothetical protein
MPRQPFPVGPFGRSENRTAIAKALRFPAPKPPTGETPKIPGLANPKRKYKE